MPLLVRTGLPRNHMDYGFGWRRYYHRKTISHLIETVLNAQQRRWPGPDLTWCLGVLGVCRLIDAIVSYAWINWVLVNFLFSLSFFGSLGLGKLDLSGPAHKPGNPSRHSTSSGEIEPQTVQMPEPQAPGHSGA